MILQFSFHFHFKGKRETGTRHTPPSQVAPGSPNLSPSLDMKSLNGSNQSIVPHYYPNMEHIGPPIHHRMTYPGHIATESSNGIYTVSTQRYVRNFILTCMSNESSIGLNLCFSEISINLQYICLFMEFIIN